MTLTIHEVEQRGDEWLALRAGMVTASVVGQLVTHSAPNAVDVMCPGCESCAGDPCISLRTGKPMKTMHSQRAEKARNEPPRLTLADDKTFRLVAGLLAAERISGSVDPDGALGGRDIWRGMDAEPFAIDAYASHYGTEVDACGFMTRELDGFTIGVSPDGLVGTDGGVEVKAPRRKGHILTAAEGEVPAAHVAQIQTALLVSGRAWWDFVSFSGGLKLWTKRVYPDPDWHAAIVAAAKHLEGVIQQLVTDYEAATADFPMTEPLPDMEITA